MEPQCPSLELPPLAAGRESLTKEMRWIFSQIKKSPSASWSTHRRPAARHSDRRVWETLPQLECVAALLPIARHWLSRRSDPLALLKGPRRQQRRQRDTGRTAARPPPSDKRCHQSRSGSGEGPVLGVHGPTRRARGAESGPPGPTCWRVSGSRPPGTRLSLQPCPRWLLQNQSSQRGPSASPSL